MQARSTCPLAHSLAFYNKRRLVSALVNQLSAKKASVDRRPDGKLAVSRGKIDDDSYMLRFWEYGVMTENVPPSLCVTTQK